MFQVGDKLSSLASPLETDCEQPQLNFKAQPDLLPLALKHLNYAWTAIISIDK